MNPGLESQKFSKWKRFDLGGGPPPIERRRGEWSEPIVGEVLSTTIEPKPLDLTIKLIFCFSFIDFEVVQSFIFRFQKIHITVSGGVIN
jgi:hypothetical protein